MAEASSPRRMPSRYDPACAALAEHFLRDAPAGDLGLAPVEQVKSMAIAIQKAVEDWYDTQEPPAPAVTHHTVTDEP